ncbi:MAG: tRNA pseudouridine(55) synthase TruB [Clostridiales Family XIII bacterium]|jgi:tRNA pseudouridine55 synthase|nr:tRNA pseudouridine(55) synthase TruB [Clostridiales Family XIII bacterium]
MNGILIVNKPQGLTSHDVISFFRRKTGVKRIGHSGTLDPMATGVLPVFIGKATRIIPFASMGDANAAKAYRCTMQLGIETDTQDIWGESLHTFQGSFPPEDEVARVLAGFQGPGTQIPPMYSAVKIGGRKLYEYARKGQEVPPDAIRPRQIYINNIYVNRYDRGAGSVVFDVESSKGVYIRTICADAGKLLGCGAVMSGLVRTKSDGFLIENSVALDTLRPEDAALPKLLPLDAPLAWMPAALLDETAARAFANGISAAAPAEAEAEVEYEAEYGAERDLPRGYGPNHSMANHQKQAKDLLRVYGPGGFVGIGTVCAKQIKPYRVFKLR